MNISGKIAVSVVGIAVYLFLGLATSKEEEFVNLTVVNPSTGCTVSNLQFSFTLEDNTLDTFNYAGAIVPNDSLTILLSSLDYRSMMYSCDCGVDSTFQSETDVSALANLSDLGTVETSCN